jgi:hypothetical protein
MKKTAFITWALFLFVNLFLVSQTPPPEGLSIRPGLRLWGLSLEIGYGDNLLFSNLQTELVLGVGAAYQSQNYFRDPGTKDFITSNDFSTANEATKAISFNQFNGYTYLGIRQALGSDFWVDGFYKLWWNYNFPENAPPESLFFQTTDNDQDGSLTHSFFVSGRYTQFQKDQITRLISGLEGTISMEFAPGVLNPLGLAHFLRSTLQIRGYVPLSRNVDQVTGRNRFSSSLALMTLTDYTWGLSPNEPFNGIPYHIRSSFGGLGSRSGLGGTIRGFESGRFDASFKNAQSVEFRMVLPTLFVPGLLPVAVVHGDFGIWAQPLDVTSNTPSFGFVGSTGLGIGLDLFGFGTLIGYTHYTFGDTLLDGGNWRPFALGFGFHF